MAANGALPATELTPIGAGLFLPKVAGIAFNNAAQHHHFRILEAGAYRPLELQKSMQKNPAKYKATKGVAKAGTSVHGTPPGAIDVDNWRDFGDIVGTNPYWYSRNLDRILAPYGFTRDPRFSNEAWHYRHDGHTTGPEPIQEDDMQLMMKRAGRPETWVFTPGRAFSTRDPGQEDRAKEAGVSFRPQPVSDPEFISYLEVFGLNEYVKDLDLFTSKRTPRGTAVLASWMKPGGSAKLTDAELAKIGASVKVTSAPTESQVAAEVIRQMKLPGN